MTFLQLINKVLIRLREDEVSTYTESAYSKLIAEFVNQAKREVEDSWKWTALRSSISISTSAATSTYSLTGSTNRTKFTHAVNDTDDVVMRLVPENYYNNLTDLGDTEQESPLYYIFYGESSNVPQIKVWPVPNGTYSLKFYGVFPQDDFSSDSTELTVPDLPVILGAYALSLSERGEDGGARYDETMDIYTKTLGDFIAMDAYKVPTETEWTVD